MQCQNQGYNSISYPLQVYQPCPKFPEELSPKTSLINDDNSINNCFVVGGGIQVDIRNDAKDALTKLLFCYYVWNLSYPKQCQFLGFLQTYVLEDKENKFDMSGSYLRFTQKYEEKLRQKYS